MITRIPTSANKKVPAMAVLLVLSIAGIFRRALYLPRSDAKTVQVGNGVQIKIKTSANVADVLIWKRVQQVDSGNTPYFVSSAFLSSLCSIISAATRPSPMPKATVKISSSTAPSKSFDAV